MAKVLSAESRGLIVSSELYQAVWQVVSDIPCGRVATYGQVARLAGYPRRARMVSKAMAAAPDSLALPWHRVINAKGQSSLPGELRDIQLGRLSEEGVAVCENRIDLQQYQWDPVFDGMLAEWTDDEAF